MRATAPLSLGTMNSSLPAKNTTIMMIWRPQAVHQPIQSPPQHRRHRQRNRSPSPNICDHHPEKIVIQAIGRIIIPPFRSNAHCRGCNLHNSAGRHRSLHQQSISRRTGVAIYLGHRSYTYGRHLIGWMKSRSAKPSSLKQNHALHLRGRPN